MASLTSLVFEKIGLKVTIWTPNKTHAAENCCRGNRFDLKTAVGQFSQKPGMLLIVWPIPLKGAHSQLLCGPACQKEFTSPLRHLRQKSRSFLGWLHPWRSSDQWLYQLDDNDAEWWSSWGGKAEEEMVVGDNQHCAQPTPDDGSAPQPLQTIF